MSGGFLSLEAQLFVQACDVVILDGEEAQLAVAAVLAGEDLELLQ